MFNKCWSDLAHKVLANEHLYVKNHKKLCQLSQGNIKIREQRGGSECQKNR